MTACRFCIDSMVQRYCKYINLYRIFLWHMEMYLVIKKWEIHMIPWDQLDVLVTVDYFCLQIKHYTVFT